MKIIAIAMLKGCKVRSNAMTFWVILGIEYAEMLKIEPIKQILDTCY